MKPKKQALVWARWAVLLVVAGVAFANALPQAWGRSSAFVGSYFDVPKVLAFGALLLVAVVLWALAFARGEAPLRLPDRLHWVVGGFLALGLVSALSGIHVPTAFFGDSEQNQGLIMWFGYAILWFLLIQTVSTKRDASDAAIVLSATGGMVAAYAIAQVLWMDLQKTAAVPKWMAVRGISTIGNPSHLAGFLIIPLALAVSLAASRQSRAIRIGATVCTALCTASIALSLTRGAWLGSLVAVAILVAVVVRTRGRLSLKHVLTAVAVVAVGLGSAAVARPDLFPWAAKRIAGAFTDGGSGRLIIWREALGMIGHHPLLGVGPDSYRLAWYGERSAQLARAGGMGISVTEPHNLLLTLAATFGIPAMLMALGLFGYVLWRSRSAILVRSEDALPLAGWWAGVVGLAIHCVFAPSPIALSTSMVLGIGVLTAAFSRTVPRVAPIRNALVVSGAVMFALVIAVVAVLTFSSDVSRTAALRGGQQALAQARTAVRLAPWSTPARLRVALVLVNESTNASFRTNETVTRGLIDQTVAEFEQVVRFSPDDLGVYWEYVYFLATACKAGLVSPEQVVSVAERGLAVDAYSVAIAMNEVVALEQLGRDDEIITVLRDRWDIDPERFEPGVAYAQALGRTGDAAQAMRVAKRLETDFPEEASVASLRSELTSAAAVAPQGKGVVSP